MEKKDSFYFQHDYNSRNDPKILMLREKFGHLGYSLFWMVLETMVEEANGHLNRGAIRGLSISFGVEPEKLTEFIDYCIKINLFKESKKGIYSLRMIQHKNIRKSFKHFGALGAKKRWSSNKQVATSVKNREAIATPIPSPIAPLMQRKGKERKGNIYINEHKVRLAKRLPLEKQTIVHRLCYHLEDELKTKIVNWGKQGKAVKMMLKAGYTEEEIRKVITYMAKKDEFFSDKGFDLMTVASQISRYKAVAEAERRNNV